MSYPISRLTALTTTKRYQDLAQSVLHVSEHTKLNTNCHHLGHLHWSGTEDVELGYTGMV